VRESGQTGLRGRLDAPSTARTCPGHAGVGRHVDDHRPRAGRGTPDARRAAARELGLRDTFGLWANLGVSLLLPSRPSFVVLAGRPLGETVLAIAVGA
jgi:hypothetical protein